jgi:hypothetical protein
VPTVQHSPGEVVKPEVPKRGQDHPEVRPRVLGAEAPGLVAAATRTAARIDGTIAQGILKEARTRISSGIDDSPPPSALMDS